MSERDRAIGCFIGLAVGDALGAPVEFKEYGEFVPLTDYRAGGVFQLPPGYWTDDTSMALCLADSILAIDQLDEQDLLERFCRWYEHGENSSTGECFDIGLTTRAALERFMAIGTYRPSVDDPRASGNGCIMRQAPVHVRWFRNRSAALSAARRQCLTTHGAQSCLRACEELAEICTDAINGRDVLADLQRFSSELGDRIPNSGFVEHTMTAAKWAVGSTEDFDGAVLAAANLGGDADTIAAVAGQIAGAIYGFSSIRANWVDHLHDSQRLIGLAEQLYDRGDQT